MALQEFLASYAVQVDEDGARRLQRILDQNRLSARELSSAFSAAYSSLVALKKELSDASGLKNVLSALSASAAASSRLPASLAAGGASGSAGAASLASSASLSGGKSVLSVSADLTSAEEALASFRAKIEAERPRLSVNPSGITAAVSSAIAQIRSIMASVRITVPVTAKASLDTSSLKTSVSVGGSSGSGSGTSAATSSGSGSSSSLVSSGSMIKLGVGGRVASPTLALIAEEGAPEYVIPTDNDSRAVPLLRSLLQELSSSAKRAIMSGLQGEKDDAVRSALSLPYASFSSTSPSKGALPSSVPIFSLPSIPSDDSPSLPASGLSGFTDLSGLFALPDTLFSLRSAFSDLTSAARSAMLPASSAAAPAAPSVQAPVNIHVTTNGSQPEALAQSIYDVTQRSLLKTLRGVFV
ncbi:MAG: hypothetical protein IJ153_04470 [Clostridia bacterium]|nr:hypothetical protein [Clostridia bacterium]